jgi:phenylacetate-CoA ligase
VTATQETAMDLYASLFRTALFPLWETHVRRRPVLERIQHLTRTQYLSLDELVSLQSTALTRLLEHAYHHVPFYRDQFASRGLTPADIRTASDLDKLPIVRRADLRTAGNTRESTAYPIPTIRKQTSGTTGEPLLFGFEHDSEDWRRAIRYRGYAWAGYEPGDLALHFWGAPLPTEPPLATRAKIYLDRRLRRELFIPCAVMTDKHLDAVVSVIRTRKPKILVTYSQAGAELARYINQHNLRTWDALPTITGAEQVTPRDRADLTQAFGPVFDVYGCREVMMIAGECEVHDGLHTSMENLVVEIAVTENGRTRPAREGETGEVVLTDLHNLAMPFIRYANGDIATAGPTIRCACGRSLPRLRSVQGRLSETLRDGNGALISGVTLSNVFYDVSSAVRQFQIVQHRDRSVTIRLVPTEELPSNALMKIRYSASRMLAGIDVRVEVVPALPRSDAGKHRLVVVER